MEERKSQTLQDIIIDILSIKNDGSNNVGDATNMSVEIKGPDGNILTPITDYDLPTIAESGSRGDYQIFFDKDATEKAFILVDQDNPYRIRLISSTSNVDPTPESIKIVSKFTTDLNDVSLGDITSQISNGVLVKRITITGDPISIIEGNAKTAQIDAGPEWDMTDKKVYFVMSKQNSSDDPIVNREVDRITDAVNGVAEIDLLSTETTPKGCYGYQVELRNDPADDEPETAMEGTAKITENLRS